jgi:hypothetical protein
MRVRKNHHEEDVMRSVWKAFYWYIMVCVLVLMAAGVFGSGCQGMVKTEKHWNSSWAGLNRTISVYTVDGRLFGRWNAKTYVETRPPVIAFVDSAGKEVKIMGGIVVVQEK